MCGRYTLTRQDGVIEELEAQLAITAASPGHEWYRPRFNVAPTQPAPVVRQVDGTRQLEMMRWGLVPHWAAGPHLPGTPRPPLLINARLETIHTKPVFRDAFRKRRCLVPADGFFEWRHAGGKRAQPQPMYIRPEPRRVVAFAGIWLRAGDLFSFAIVTGAPNALVAPIHDRMPVVIPHDRYAAWLDPALDADAARALMEPAPIDDWRADPVSARVNQWANDDAENIVPVPAAPDAPAQPTLF